ncbi:DegT/DnrJ/EryC1/StrS family aminotransferase [Scytonema sp. NUACC21]
MAQLTVAKYAFAPWAAPFRSIATSDGNNALLCGLKVLGIGFGDEVIVPDLTFVASV